MALFLITAPSGAGKTTLAQILQSKRYWQECISHTTRPMREGEKEGHTYYFVNREHFIEMDNEASFAEVVEYDGNLYGITKNEIKEKTKGSNHAFIIVDYNGYKQVKKMYPQSIGIFLYMTKEDCLANMLLRGDSIKDAMRRIEKYESEFANRVDFDYVIKNVRDKLNETVTLMKFLICQY